MGSWQSHSSCLWGLKTFKFKVVDIPTKIVRTFAWAREQIWPDALSAGTSNWYGYQRELNPGCWVQVLCLNHRATAIPVFDAYVLNNNTGRKSSAPFWLELKTSSWIEVEAHESACCVLCSASSAMVQSSSLRADHESTAAAATLQPSTSAPCFLRDPPKQSTPISVPSHIRFYKQAEHDRQSLLRCCPTKVPLCYLITLHASCSVMYCNRSCLWVCVWVGLLPW